MSAAISDISAYIQLTDTKVSIIMAAVVGILVGIASCYDPIYMLVKNIVPCSWIWHWYNPLKVDTWKNKKISRLL